jgi:serine phosphatase RsbU (regulator of sigma subunit)
VSETNHSPARVLIVDDLEVNRELLARRVSRQGHAVGFAANGREALAALREAPWDLVLLDITMPELDGYQTLQAIKDDAALAGLPVIMVSAIEETDSVVRCIELGADDYLTKPFNPVVLRARVESSLNKKRLADQRQATLRALAREMEIGQRIQRGFLPETLPQPRGWQLAAHCVPARHVGGDFYDALQLADGRLALAIADVCDKGVGAALYMALFRSLLRASLLHAPAGDAAEWMLARAVSFTNDYIADEHGRDHMFASLFIGVLDPASGRLHYVNAGHEAPVVRRCDSATLHRLEPQGAVLGLVSGARHPVGAVDLDPGDCLLAYTDGVTEAEGDAGPFGEPAMLDVVAQGTDGAAVLVDALVERLAAYTGAHPAHDDITLLALQRQR